MPFGFIASRTHWFAPRNSSDTAQASGQIWSYQQCVGWYQIACLPCFAQHNLASSRHILQQHPTSEVEEQRTRIGT